ncbi:hypothetical protein V5O48_017110, partial [Marasmius crinis-equi]
MATGKASKKGSSSRKIRHISGSNQQVSVPSTSRLYGSREVNKIRTAKKLQITQPSRLGLQDNDGDGCASAEEEDHSGMVDGALQGDVVIETSHQGGELDDLVYKMQDVLSRKRRRDRRTRQDRTEKRTAAFAAQIESMADAYMVWSESLGDFGLARDPAELEVEDSLQFLNVTLVDMFSAFFICFVVPIADLGATLNVAVQNSRIYINNEVDKTVGAAFIRQGFLPCSPINPTVAISLRTLEFFIFMSLRCPKLAAHAFVKGLCDIHGVIYRPYLYQQFLITIDLYHDIQRIIDARVKKALGRDSKDWRLANACPCCMYKVVGEQSLLFSMLFAMDGNNSLKRMKRLEGVFDEHGAKVASAGPSIEHPDSRAVSSDFYLTRQEVDRFEEGNWKNWEEWEDVEVDEPNPCEERWRNMNEKNTASSWAMYEETGVFLALCRHSFVLLIVDMIESGEMAKYPLAVVHRLLTVLGECLGGGYDIGCKFASTIRRSPLKKLAERLRYKSLVGIFHGHGHNRLCQTENLGTYVPGTGKEDLENLERFFSHSNDLASTVRHASSFHRQQTITAYLHHTDDFDTFQRLSKFLTDRFKQAAEILLTQDAVHRSLESLGVSSLKDVEGWLAEEKEYLSSLRKEPQEETLKMDYYRALKKYNEHSEMLKDLSLVWVNTPSQGLNKELTDINNRRRKLVDDVDSARHNVLALEAKLLIPADGRWTPNSTQWKEAEALVTRATYQRSLDKLEGLIVARLFELTKMNRSNTGYKLRSHIGKAIKSRSQAIKTALDKFNSASASLFPDRPLLQWDEVVKYVFLADFDLLRETRCDIRERSWATPAGRAALDGYHQLQRAREEIDRVHVEVRRLMTWMRDEESYLAKKLEEYQEKDPNLAHQIRRYSQRRGRAFDVHRERLHKLQKVPGFNPAMLLP